MPHLRLAEYPGSSRLLEHDLSVGHERVVEAAVCQLTVRDANPKQVAVSKINCRQLRLAEIRTVELSSPTVRAAELCAFDTKMLGEHVSENGICQISVV